MSDIGCRYFQLLNREASLVERLHHVLDDDDESDEVSKIKDHKQGNYCSIQNISSAAEFFLRKDMRWPNL